MKVKMLVNLPGMTPAMNAGDVVEVAQVVGQGMIDNKLAELVSDAPKAAPEMIAGDGVDSRKPSDAPTFDSMGARKKK